MKDGLQNVPFDRWLMRTKDILNIIQNIFTIIAVTLGGLWIGFKFVQSQSEMQRFQSEMQRFQSESRQMILDQQKFLNDLSKGLPTGTKTP